VRSRHRVACRCARVECRAARWSALVVRSSRESARKDDPPIAGARCSGAGAGGHRTRVSDARRDRGRNRAVHWQRIHEYMPDLHKKGLSMCVTLSQVDIYIHVLDNNAVKQHYCL